MTKTVFRLPDIGEGVVEGEIVEWHIRPGDAVVEDQPLVDVMTDKATVTIPSGVSGRVESTHGRVGEMVPVGSELVVFNLGEDDENSDELEHATTLDIMRAQRTPSPPALGPPPVSTLPRPSDGLQSRPTASPAVRRRAREKGVDLTQVTGTGRGGRITDNDIEIFLKSNRGDDVRHVRMQRSGVEEVHMAGLRRKIAEKMSVSMKHIPHFTYIEEVDITELAGLRQHLNDHRSPDEPKLTYLPFIMLALARAFRKHPQANAHYDEARETVLRYEAVHLGIATQTERGLYVPVVRHVEAMDLWEVARELRRVTQATRHNTIKREDLTGSTFTITSLGAMGGLAATPIINHPEVGILGVHRASDRAVVQHGQVVVRHMVNLSASFDHRVVDGYEGAALIQTVRDYLQHPATIFI